MKEITVAVTVSTDERNDDVARQNAEQLVQRLIARSHSAQEVLDDSIYEISDITEKDAEVDNQ